MIELLLCLAIDTQINGPGYVNLTLTKGDSVEFTLEEASLESFLVFDSLISGKLSLQIPPFTKAISISTNTKFEYTHDIETNLAIFTVEKFKCEHSLYLTGIYDLDWRASANPNTCVFPIASDYLFSVQMDTTIIPQRFVPSSTFDVPFYLFIPNATTAHALLTRGLTVEMKWNFCETGSFSNSSSNASIICRNPYEVPDPSSPLKEYIIGSVLVAIFGVILPLILTNLRFPRCRRELPTTDSAYGQLRLDLFQN